MSVSAISSAGNLRSLGGIGDVSTLDATNTQKSTAATGDADKVASAAAAAATSNSGDVTTVVTMADGGTVTTVRNKANEIVSINTTPPTRPPDVAMLPSSSGPSNGKVDLLA